MIDFHSLRIDNWILNKGTPVQVYMLAKGLTHYTVNGVSLDKKTGKVMGTDEDRFSPVELTPEVFLACDGRDIGGRIAKFVPTNVDGNPVTFVFDLYSAVLHIHVNDITLRKLENPCLHDLQNIYKDLTKKELSYHPVTISEKTE